MPDPANDNPTQLYTMAEAAAYCKRSLALFRKGYKNGMLPDPVNTTVQGKKGKVRMYTLAECKQLKAHFESQKPGPKKRTRKRKS